MNPDNSVNLHQIKLGGRSDAVFRAKGGATRRDQVQQGIVPEAGHGDN
jgi:hypothetical protein